MKYPFVCGTIQAKRKGNEVLAPTTHHHPAREEVILSPKEVSRLPVRVLPKAEKPAEPSTAELLARVQAEVAKLNAAKPKAKPSARTSGLIKIAEQEPPKVEPMPMNDILKLLAALKK